MTIWTLLLHPILFLPVHPAPVTIDCSTIPPEAPPIAACWTNPIVVPLPPGTTVVTTGSPSMVTTATAPPAPHCDSTVVHFTPEPGDLPIYGSPWFCPPAKPATTVTQPAPPAVVTGCRIPAGRTECVGRQIVEGVHLIPPLVIVRKP